MNKKFYLIFSNVFLVLLMLSFISIDTFGQSVKIKASPDSSLCVGQTLTLTRMYTPEVGDTNTTFTVYYKGNTPLDTANLFIKNNIVLTDAGKYRVKVFDIHGLEAEDSINIKVNKIPKFDSITIKNPSKCGSKDGQFILHGLDKDSTYSLSYTLNNIVITPISIKANGMGKLIKDNLGAGKYTKIKVKLKGCESVVSLDSLELKDPTATPAVLIINQEMCYGTTIDIDEKPLGGVLSIFSGPGIITGNPKKLTTTNGSGDQIVVQYVYTDTLNCKDTSQSLVFVNPLPVINSVVTNVTCNGFNDGTITITPSNNTYKWSKADESGNIANGLMPGTYSVTVTTDKECMDNKGNIIVIEPPMLTEEKINDNLTLCFNTPETIDVNINGGNGQYNILWTNPDADESSDFAIDFVKPGIYKITITDAKNCQLIKEVNVVENDEIKLNIMSSDGNLLMDHFCTGESIKLTAIGAQDYMWANGKSSNVITENIDGLYSVTGSVNMNMRNCSVEKSINIMKDPLPIITFKDEGGIQDKIFRICNGDTLNLNVSGNNPLYEYQWKDEPIISGLRSLQDTAYYPIIVTENNTGCFSIDSVELKFKNTKYVNILLPSMEIYEDSIKFCNTINELFFEFNGPVSTSGDYTFPKWVIKKDGFPNETTTNSNFSLNYINFKDNFRLIAIASDKKGCVSSDSIEFLLQKAEYDIFDTIFCGTVLIENSYFINEPLPNGVTKLGNGFYFIEGMAKFNYTIIGSKNDSCRFDMPSPIINEISDQEIIKEDLIYDECGPFLLAKDNGSFCYTWYKIDKSTNVHYLIPNVHTSYYSLSEEDYKEFEYVAIGQKCTNKCDTTIISTRSSDGGKTIPCYNSGESTIKIYPNPNQGHMYLKLQGLPAGKQEVFIYDMMGRQVYKKTVDHTGNNDTTELSLTHLPDGIYFAKIYYNGTGISTKFIIKH